jgi:ADP-ribose pyrophosphatase
VAGRALLEIPAGKLEGPDDDPAARGQAELSEEVGYRAGRLIPAARFFVSPGYCTEVIHVYLGLDLIPAAAQPEATEEIERVELSLAETRRMLVAGEFHDSKTIVGLWALLAHLEEERGQR